LYVTNPQGQFKAPDASPSLMLSQSASVQTPGDRRRDMQTTDQDSPTDQRLALETTQSLNLDEP